MSKLVPRDESFNASIFASSLSPEIVTQGQIEGLANQATHLLAIDGASTTINGTPAVVTKSSTPCIIQGETYHVRAFRQGGTRDPDTVVGVVFGESATTEKITTPNPNVIRFRKFGDNVDLVVDNELNPRVDDPNDAKTVAQLLLKLSDSITETQERQRQNAEAERARNARARIEKREHRHRKLLHLAGWTAATAAAVSAAGGISYAVYEQQQQPSFNQRFDAHPYTLPGGNEIELGKTGLVAYSPELFDDNQLSASKVPDIHYAGSSNNDSIESPLPSTGKLREIQVHAGTCYSFEAAPAPIGTDIRAWTDYTSATGQELARDVSVRYTLDGSEVCVRKDPVEGNAHIARVVLSLDLPTSNTSHR